MSPGSIPASCPKPKQVNPNTFVVCFFNMKHIPFSGRNPVFQESLDVRPHLLVLNKTDLTDLSNKQVRSRAAVSGESQFYQWF